MSGRVRIWWESAVLPVGSLVRKALESVKL